MNAPPWILIALAAGSVLAGCDTQVIAGTSTNPGAGGATTISSGRGGSGGATTATTSVTSTATTSGTTSTSGTAGDAGSLGAVCTDPSTCAYPVWARALDLAAMTPLAVDGAGRVLFGGRTVAGSLDLGAGPVPGNVDGFVAALGSTGDAAFAAALDPGQQPSAVAADAAGNVIVLGTFTGAIGMSPSSFLRKLDSAGQTLWTVTILSGPDWGNALELRDLAVRPDGSLLAVGYLRGQVQVGGVTLSAAYGTSLNTAVLLAFDAGGKLLWHRGVVESNNGSVGAVVAVDAGGQAWMAGDSGGQKGSGFGISFPGCTAVGPATPITQVFLARFDGQGTCPLVERFDGRAYQKATTLLLAGGDVYLGGTVSGQDPSNTGAIDLGGGLLSSSAGSAGYLGRRTGGGAHVWSRPLSEGSAGKFAVDQSGRVVLPGSFAGSLTMFGAPQPSVGDEDIYLARLGAGGAADLALRYGGAGKDGALSAALDPSGAVLMNGVFTTAVDFGGGALTASAHGSDASDFFVVKLALH